MPEGIKKVAAGGYEPSTKGLASLLLTYCFNVSSTPSPFLNDITV